MKTIIGRFTSHALRPVLGLVITALALLDSAPPLLSQTVVAWGNNDFGQNNVPASATNVIAVAAGATHGLALRANGTIVGWGGTNAVPGGLADVIAIAAGAFHSVALRADGSVAAWGNNDYWQTNVPPTATNILAIACGDYFSVGLNKDGNLIVWGDMNQDPSLGINHFPAEMTNLVAISAGPRSILALRADGSVLRWGGRGFWPQPGYEIPGLVKPLSLKDVVDVSGVNVQPLALVAGGAVARFAQAKPVVPDQATNTVLLACGKYYNLALSDLGTLLGWGSANPLLSPPPLVSTNVIAMAVGASNALAVVSTRSAPRLYGFCYAKQAASGACLPFYARATGTPPLAYQWLADGVPIPGAQTDFPRLPAVLGTDNVGYQVIVSNAFGCVTSTVAKVTITSVNFWGDPFSQARRIPPTITNTIGIAAGNGHALAINADGSISAWGKNADGQATPPANATNVVALAAGGDHSLALRADGSVLGWGRNWDGQIDVPSAATNLVAVAAGKAHSIALRADGTAVAWGNDDYGQINTLLFPTNLVAISAGQFHSLALGADGRVVTCGLDYATPAEATNIVAISAGWEHCLALRADGAVFAWGDNTFEQSTVPASATNVVALSAGYYHNLALRADGSVVAWGKPRLGVTTTPPLLRAAAIASGEDFSLAMASSGGPRILRQPLSTTAGAGRPALLSATAAADSSTTCQWYRNGQAITGATNTFLFLLSILPGDAGNYVLVFTNPSGQASTQPAVLNVLQAPTILPSQPFQCATPGTVVCLAPEVAGTQPISYRWLHNGASLADDARISGAATARLCFAGTTFSDEGVYILIASNAFGCATGTVAQLSVSPIISWGDNSAGQLNVPPGTHDVSALAAGGAHSLALLADGSVRAWGDNTLGQLEVSPAATNISAIAAGANHSLALRPDGSVVAWGDNTFGQASPPANATNLVAITAGAAHSAGLTRDGLVIAWGHPSQTNIPAAATNVAALAAGESFTLALKKDGSMISWGAAPAFPPLLPNVVSLAAGGGFCLAVQADTTISAWGTKYYGQCSPPPGVSNVVRVSAGGMHGIALKSDATLVAWGANNAGQSSIPSIASNVLAVTAGGSHNLALVSATLWSGKPVVTQQPVDCRIPLDRTANLFCAVVGELPLSLQWFFANTPVSSGTNAWLSLPNLQAAQAGLYYAVAANSLGAVTSRVATVSIFAPPSIVRAPVSANFPLGTSGSLSAVAAGDEPLGYQWLKYGYPIPFDSTYSNNGPVLTFRWFRLSDEGSYTLTITNAAGTVTSDPVQVSADIPPPALLSSPAPQTLPAGSNATFTVNATGYDHLNYLWFFNQTNPVGFDGPSLYLCNVQPRNEGDYQVVVSDAYGNSVTSAPARLTVLSSPPRLLSQPRSMAATAGWVAYFGASAQGLEPLYYQWQRNGVDIPGSSTNHYFITNVQPVDAGTYRLSVRNSAGSTSTIPAFLFVLPKLNLGERFAGSNFLVEFKDHMEDTNWYQLQQTNDPATTGAVQDTNPPPTTRFYRLRTR